jgi:hypothetical protein
MSRFAKRASVVGVCLLAIAAPARSANNAEQVVFSTPGFVMDLVGNSKASETPFGFWIWCAAEASPTSKGGYQNDHACQGSMYFYALDRHPESIIGQVHETDDGIYVMDVIDGTFAQLRTGTLHPTFSCELTNVTPDPIGTGNGVQVSCVFLDPALGGGSGGALVTNAVVNVTGP